MIDFIDGNTISVDSKPNLEYDLQSTHIVSMTSYLMIWVETFLKANDRHIIRLNDL